MRHRTASYEPDTADACKNPCDFCYGLYKPIVELGGAGATVPLTGFGYSLANGAIDGAMNEGLLGAITGGVKATAGGIAAAVLFGYAFALIFTPKTKK